MSMVSLFFIVLIVAFAAIFYVTEPSKEDKLIDARLNSVDRNVVVSNDGDRTILRDVIFSRVPSFDRILRRNAIALYLQRLLGQADVSWTVGRVAFATLLCIGAGALLGNWWIAPGLLGWLPGLLLGIVPVMVLLQMRKRRFNRFANLLPEAVDLMSRCLRSGQAISATVSVVATEIPDPLGTEFQRSSDEQNFGLPFRESMLNLLSRMPIADLQFLITAILVQKETGGDLVEILEKTSHLLRERLRVKGEMRVRTAQARVSAWILCLLPVAIYFGLNVISPGYSRVLLEDPTGRKWVASAVVMMIIGVMFIRRIVNVKV